MDSRDLAFRKKNFLTFIQNNDLSFYENYIRKFQRQLNVAGLKLAKSNKFSLITFCKLKVRCRIPNGHEFKNFMFIIKEFLICHPDFNALKIVCENEKKREFYLTYK